MIFELNMYTSPGSSAPVSTSAADTIDAERAKALYVSSPRLNHSVSFETRPPASAMGMTLAPIAASASTVASSNSISGALNI